MSLMLKREHLKNIYIAIKLILLTILLAALVYWIVLVFMPWKISLNEVFQKFKLIISLTSIVYVMLEVFSFCLKCKSYFQEFKDEKQIKLTKIISIFVSFIVLFSFVTFIILFNQITNYSSMIIVIYFKDKTTLFFFGILVLFVWLFYIYKIINFIISIKKKIKRRTEVEKKKI